MITLWKCFVSKLGSMASTKMDDAFIRRVFRRERPLNIDFKHESEEIDLDLNRRCVFGDNACSYMLHTINRCYRADHGCSFSNLVETFVISCSMRETLRFL